MNPKDPVRTAKWTTGSVRQRTHDVNVKEGNIYVTVSDVDGTLDSDRYNKRQEDNT